MMSIEKTKYPMSDEQVRRRLFWLLQRLSSYTACGSANGMPGRILHNNMSKH